MAAVFAGQGSHFIGMYQSLAEQYKIVRDTIEEAEEATGVHLRELCASGPLSVLSEPQNAHTAIVAFGVAAFRVFISETGCVPKLCAGHSLGEYTALICAGALNFSEALRLIQVRCRIGQDVKDSTRGGMTVVDGMDVRHVEDICGRQRQLGSEVYLSCRNTDRQSSISGVGGALEDTERLLSKSGASVSPLFDSAPFHSPIMKGGADALRAELKKMRIGEFRYPVMSNFTGKPYGGTGDIMDNLLCHLTNVVRWSDIIAYFQRVGITTIVDFSANNIFGKMTRNAICFGSKKGRDTLFGYSEKLGRHNLDFASKCMRAAVSTQNLNNNPEEYRTGVNEAYQRLREISSGIKNGSLNCSEDAKREMLKLLKKIFDTKGVGALEQERWIYSILEETGSVYQQLLQQ